MENNYAILSGVSNKDFKFLNATKKENFYKFTLNVKRNSGAYDTLEVVISDKLLTEEIKNADYLQVEGKVRTYNAEQGRVEMFLYSQTFTILEEETHYNKVKIDGFLCIKRNIRTTHSNRRVIDAVIAVNRMFRKTDYVSVIAWGRDAEYINNSNISDNFVIEGRFQSRKYVKTIGEEKIERMAYEISANVVTKKVNTDNDSEGELYA